MTKISGRRRGMSQKTIIAVLVTVTVILLVLLLFGANFLQDRAESLALDSLPDKTTLEGRKILAEIQQIRSNTRGSLFGLKLVTLLLSIAGAVAGYLFAQDRATQARIEFEKQKSIDEAFQAIINDLAGKEDLLRAAAAIRLGTILQSFPLEWDVEADRIVQIKQRIKQILAAALSIEKSPKVLKTLTIALALRETESTDMPNLKGLDLSGANAHDAYWARVDLSGADFFKANLSGASFRKSRLQYAQFRESDLCNAVLIEADCDQANFKLADLRNANLSRAALAEANFEGAKVFGTQLKDAKLERNPDCQVDVSANGDGSEMISFRDWSSGLREQENPSAP